MKCPICHNNIDLNKKCIFCPSYFCSNICMKYHIYLSHNEKSNHNIISTNNNNNSNNIKAYNKEKNEAKIKSPYIVPGILSIRRTYNQKYNLNNFDPIFENGEPKIIGCGSFGQVFLVMNKIDQKFYAIKHMEKKILSEKLNNLEGIYKEIYIQSRIDHPNILPILYVNETISDFDLVLEFASHGSLFHFIRKHKSLNEPLSFSLFIQVVNAVFFLHKNNLIHRDIKPENILLFENNILKLCDFGWCVKLEDGQQRDTYCGTTEYMSPELVNHIEYSKEIDVWSLGVLLYEMVHGYSPFRPEKPHFNSKDVIHNIRMHKLKFKKNVSEEYKELVYHLLDENPKTRYKVENIFNSNFVKFFENMKFGFPNKYLVERYKFKIVKARNQNNIKNNEFIDKLKMIYNKKNNKYKLDKSEMPISFSDTNLVGKKRTKNKTSEYFHSLSDVDQNNENYLYSKKVKAKSNSYNNRKKEQKKYNSINKNICFEKKIKTIMINNFFHNNFKKNNTDHKEIINNNNQYINIKENFDEQTSNDNKNKHQLKNNFNIKQLKIGKIPINTKNMNHAHSPTSVFNYSLANKKNMIFNKKNISPHNKLITEISKSNSFKKTKGKILEMKFKTKKSISPKNNNIINSKINIKKANTRNNLKNNNEIKINYLSEDNIIKTNANTNSNNSLVNNIINYNKDDTFDKKIYLGYTKSLNYLKRKVDNNIKSMFISNIKNKISKNMNYHSNTLNSDKKKKNNRSYKNEEEIGGIKRIHTSVGSVGSVGCTPKNNIYNNIFILTNIINERNKKNHIFRDNMTPNISYNLNKNYSFSGNNNTNNYYSRKRFFNITTNNLTDKNKKIFSKKKLLKKNSPDSINNFVEFTKYKINLDKILNNENEPINRNNKNQSYYYEKNTKNINSVGYNSIFNQTKKSPNDIPKIKINYMNNNTNIKILKKNTNLKSFNRKMNDNLNRYNSNNNIISLRSKQKENSCKGDKEYDLQYKYKLLRKLDLNEFFNNLKLNKNKKGIIPIKTENYYNINCNCNTSYNLKNKKINISVNKKKINNNNYNYCNNKKKLDLEIYNNMSSRIIKNNNNKYSFCSRNYNKIKDKEKTANIKSSHNNISNLQKCYINNKTLNLDNKKIIIKKEPKIIITPIIQKYKDDINMNNCNEINNNENINYINKRKKNNIII